MGDHTEDCMEQAEKTVGTPTLPMDLSKDKMREILSSLMGLRGLPAIRIVVAKKAKAYKTILADQEAYKLRLKAKIKDIDADIVSSKTNVRAYEDFLSTVDGLLEDTGLSSLQVAPQVVSDSALGEPRAVEYSLQDLSEEDREWAEKGLCTAKDSRSKRCRRRLNTHKEKSTFLCEGHYEALDSEQDVVVPLKRGKSK